MVGLTGRTDLSWILQYPAPLEGTGGGVERNHRGTVVLHGPVERRERTPVLGGPTTPIRYLRFGDRKNVPRVGARLLLPRRESLEVLEVPVPLSRKGPVLERVVVAKLFHLHGPPPPLQEVQLEVPSSLELLPGRVTPLPVESP